MSDPLRGPDGRYRSPTLTERLFGPPAAPPPAPPPEPPKPRGRMIPAGPMGTEPPEGDLIRLALRHRRP
jgi:hypothetical protein